MSFIPSNERIVLGIGSREAKIALVGEAPGAEEDRLLRPFVGPAGTVLETCMHAANIMRSECYITNTIKVRPKGNNIALYYNEKTNQFTAEGKRWITYLAEELADVKANTIVALGKVAMSALTGNRHISTLRGYVMPATAAFSGRKVIPAYHPAASLRGQYILRYYITADLKKAKREGEFPSIERPTRHIVIPTTISECEEWIAYLHNVPAFACDIEVVNFEVSCIGFAPTGELAITIPMYHNHWSENEEAHLWKKIAELMGNRGVRKVFQNGIFDVNFLLMRCGVHTKGVIDDTMIAHHVMYPEMLKGLGFLVSMYCGAQEYYKDMVKFDNIKKES